MFLFWYWCWSLLDLLLFLRLLWLLFWYGCWLCKLRFCFSWCLKFRPWHYFIQYFVICLVWFWWNNFSWFSWWSFDLLGYFLRIILLYYLSFLSFNLINFYLFLFLLFFLFLFLWLWLFLFLLNNLFLIIFKIRIDKRSINCNTFWLKLLFRLFLLLYCSLDHRWRFWYIFSLILSCFIQKIWLFSIWNWRRSSCYLVLILYLIFILVCLRLSYLYLRIYIFLLLLKNFRGYFFIIRNLLIFSIFINCLIFHSPI